MIENIIYKIEDNSKENFKLLDFHHIGDGIYRHIFAGYRWQGYTTITCQFLGYDDSNRIIISVYQEDGNLYAPYYKESNDNEVLKIVNKNIERELKKCGIKRYKLKEKNIFIKKNY